MHQVLFNANVSIADRYKLTQDQSWHDEAIYRISGLSHNYDTGAAGNLPLLERIASVEPGVRAADVVMSKAAPRRRLYDIFRHTDFTLLLLPGAAAKNSDVSRATATAVKHRYGHRVKCAVIARQAVDGLDCDQAFEDPSESVREAYRCNGEGKMVLVRPDLYVDYVGSLDDVEALSGHVRQHWLA
jgi:hypothetical protein